MTSTKSLLLAAALGSIPILAQDLPASHGPPSCANPLAWGFYATPETQTPTALEVTGTIPRWLKGSLIRGAAGTWDVGNFTAEHWFDGFSRNHAFHVADGAVTYRSRNGSDELRSFVQETGLYPNGAFGGDPCKIIFGAFETTFRDASNAHGDASSDNIGVSWIANFPGLANETDGAGGAFRTLVATSDVNALQQINPITMEPMELFTYEASHPLLANAGRAAAHPAVALDGSLYNYNLDLDASPPTYRVFGVQAPSGNASVLATITDAPPAYIHSVFATERHVVLIVWQADYAQPGRTLMESLGEWDPERPALFYVVDRLEGGVVAKYAAPESFFAFHQVNSFEDEAGDILIDLPRMDDLSFIENAHVPTLRANLGRNGSAATDLQGEFTRFRLPKPTGPTTNPDGTLVTLPASVDFTIPYTSASIELPRINEAYTGRPYRYAYGVHTARPGAFVDSIIKVDTHTRTHATWEPATPHFPSEPIFVAAPGADREDDGVLLLVAMSAAERVSSMIVLNATTLEELGRARMPVVMGYTFHGIWGSLQ
ncbi:hypothetical protein S7711_09899 [Stachybotrys chartarum IBT 7711]|uniref:Uncharacterized protein n=1 Tax=Stachybotrys chartarum (strain CBS 109288 / IBT 7711) TaxID=1280523 RepID=A0A084BAU3_STACB|nr:hypothetical protein S7711_09899 [Stachybotrys chartarum IBT 7711]